MKRLILSLIIASIFVPAAASAAPVVQPTADTIAALDGASCMTGSVKQMAQEPITGDAFLCADPDGVRAQIHVTNLTPGTVYTLWFAYLDKRADCAAAACGGPDFLGDNPVGVFGHMDSAIANATGNATFGGALPGMQLSNGSEAWLLIFNHGPASTDDHRILARQLLTPQDPTFGAPAAGTKADGTKGSGTAIAVFDIG